jgi:formamidopyrimidine-DNA glycosylase
VPELPEVETIRRQLEPLVVGRRIVQASIDDPRLTAPESPGTVAHRLVGERIAALDRHGKYLDVVFESGNHLLVHLRMTGSFRHTRRSESPDDPYTRAVVSLDDGSDVTYRDVRRFGTWKLMGSEEVTRYLGARLGPEPLGGGFTAGWLAAALARRRAAVKAALLDQRIVAGMGNIYADEALWSARINPLRPASSLSREELLRLVRAVRSVLRRGVARQGATLRDYRAPDGASGSMQDAFRVYGREGQPCPRCGAAIVHTVVAGRGTHYCPACQPWSLA